MRATPLLTAATAAVLLAGCSSSATSGHGGTGGGSTAPSSTGSSSAPSTALSPAAPAGSTGVAPTGSTGAAPAGTATDAKTLFALLRAGVADVRSLHVALSTKAATVSVTGSGDEQLSHGQLTALDLSETVQGAGIVRIIHVGTKTYVKLPVTANRSSTKPYTLVTTTSQDPVIRSLASQLSSTLDSSSVTSYSLLAQAATSVRGIGLTTVAGAPATHYSIVVDVARLPATFPNRAAVVASGVKTIPVDLYVDAHGRPVKVTEEFSIGGQHVSVILVTSRYDVPVHIVAPPASQVSVR